MGFNVDRAPDEMIVNVLAVNVRGKDVGVLPTEDFRCELLPDFVRLRRRDVILRRERLYEVTSEGVAAGVCLV
jgi:hypothetical protein